MAKSSLDWKNNGQQVDTDGLSKPLAALYGKYKGFSSQAREARLEFEAAFTKAAKDAKMLTDGQVFAFGYKFGKMTVVATDAVAPVKKTTGIKL